MITFTPRGGLPACERFFSRVRLPLHAPSLGGTETLVIRPAASSHAGLSARDREEIGIRAEMIRVSVGIEGSDDLVADFRQALD